MVFKRLAGFHVNEGVCSLATVSKEVGINAVIGRSKGVHCCWVKLLQCCHWLQLGVCCACESHLQPPGHYLGVLRVNQVPGRIL